MEVSNDEKYLACYNAHRIGIYSKELRFSEAELVVSASIFSVKFSKNGKLLAVAANDGVYV